MRITKITVRGEAGGFAEMTAEDTGGGRTVEVEMIEPGGEQVLRAPASNPHALWELATRVQERLDGRPTGGADICGYFELIAQVAAG